MDTSATSEDVIRIVSLLAQGRVQPLKVARRAVVRYALAQLEGNVSQAAAMLQISRGTIYRYAR